MKKKQKTVGSGRYLVFKDLPDDTILVVFGFTQFPTLCQVKPVCKWWLQSVDNGIALRLGKKQFLSRDELLKAVGKYYNDKRKFSEVLATTYG